MLHTNNCHSNNNNDEKEQDIIKRLKDLSIWQEEQKRLLEERQDMQRKMFGLEKRSMYQMMGMLQVEPTEDAAETIGDGGESAEKSKSEMSQNINIDKEIQGMQTVNNLNKTLAAMEAESKNDEFLAAFEKLEKPKRPFLKRGEGLKQRFKISPEALRLNNLPRYKFSKRHCGARNATKQAKSTTAIKQRCGAARVAKKESTCFPNPPPPSVIALPLNTAEKEFQQLLVAPATHSTPTDAKNSFSSISSLSVRLPKVRFKNDPVLEESEREQELTEKVSSNLAAIAWSEILDSQQIKPISLQQMRPKDVRLSCSNDLKQHIDDSNLSIFELIEQKANAGSINMESPCIKRFMERKFENKMHESEEMRAENNLRQLGLRPIPEDLHDLKIKEANLGTEDECSSSNEHHSPQLSPQHSPQLTPQHSPQVSTQHSPQFSSQYSSQLSPQHSPRVFKHVHFTDEKNEVIENVMEVTDDSISQDGMDELERSSDLFQQFKDALYSALMAHGELRTDSAPATPSRNDSGSTANASPNNVPPTHVTLVSQCNEDNLSACSEITLTPSVRCNSVPNTSSFNRLQVPIKKSPPSLLTCELQEKSALVKERLNELETEIAAFKENNKQLLKERQKHEMEKAHFSQERLEILDKLNDDKIRMEIYLHDERMKIEDERQRNEQQVRVQRQSKDVREIARLKQELDQVKLSIKQKDAAHASSQSRLRVQIRSLEREQKSMLEDIERLQKENKRLQTEKIQAEREINNKMLIEINRNIAKLAPKLPVAAKVASESKNIPKSKLNYVKLVASKPPKIISRKPVVSAECASPPPPPVSPSDSMDSLYDAPKKAKKQIAFCSPKEASKSLYDEKYEDIDEYDEENLEISKEMQTSVEVISKHKTQKTPPIQNAKPADESKNDFKREIINEDGSKDIWYSNGNLKKISADGMLIRMLYYNKDIKETNANVGTVKYYYAETNTWHTTYLDGLEILEFPNGQTEHRYKNGVVEIHFPDNSIKITDAKDERKQEEWRFVDGTTLVQMRNGDKILNLPNGQKEIHTKLHKRREYPDGTVKIVYPDGSQETRYSNGRIRLKDKEGRLVLDTDTAP